MIPDQTEIPGQRQPSGDFQFWPQPLLRFEALVRLSIVEQVADAVHGVLEDGGRSEDHDANGRFDEGDDVEGGDEAGELADVAQILECFHGTSEPVSTLPQLPDHRNEGEDSNCETNDERGDSQVPLDLFLE